MHRPLIDPVTIEGLRALGGDDDPSLLHELIDLYLEDGSERVACLDAAAEAGDAGELARVAHALKSASASIGASPIFEMCAELEVRARTEGWDGELAALVERLRQTFLLVRGELEEIQGRR